MSKPSWKGAPEWANYRARDQYSGWWWYELNPIWDNENEEWDTQYESKAIRASAGFERIGAKNSLGARP